jgi:predicted ArsR family transcriptional regulator
MPRKPSEIPTRIVSLLRNESGLSSVQIAERFSIGRATAFIHLRALVASGKIRYKGRGKATRYYTANPLSSS